MKVSVIIPFYSEMKWLEEAVESVLNQTYSDFEILVVNDGSPEDDSMFLQKYKSFISYYKTENRGPAHARNFGISKSKGEYIAFLDSDDLFCPTKLEKQVSFMNQNSLNWSHTKYSTFNEVMDVSQRKFEVVDNTGFQGMVFPKSLISLKIGTPCVMVRRQVLLDNPFIRFSENMRFGQDGYFWNLIAIEHELGYIDEILTLVRRSGSNAVQKARIHLNVRANLYFNLIKKIKQFYPNVSIPILLRGVYFYCFCTDRLLDWVFGVKNRRNSVVENISKILYLPAYIFFKVLN